MARPAEGEFPGLTGSETFIYKWQYRLLGDFGHALVQAYLAADSSNRARLGIAFPEEAMALDSYLEEPGWWDSLQEKLRELEYLRPEQA